MLNEILILMFNFKNDNYKHLLTKVLQTKVQIKIANLL